MDLTTFFKRHKDVVSTYDMDLSTFFINNQHKDVVSTYDIACLMKQLYKGDYICVSIEHSRWYYYDQEKHRWFLDDQGIRL